MIRTKEINNKAIVDKVILCVMVTLHVIYSFSTYFSSLLGFSSMMGFGLVLLGISLYYAVHVNTKYRVTPFIKAYNILVLMFAAYGIFRAIGGEVLFVGYRSVSSVYYIGDTLTSLMPFYAYYVLSKREVIGDWFIRIVFFAVLAFSILYYNLIEANYLVTHTNENVTNNVAYFFVALLPFVPFFSGKRIVQYAIIMVISFFLLNGMKRGAILCGALSILIFIYHELKQTNSTRRIYFIILTCIAIYFIGLYVFDLLNTSDYFVFRLEETMEGSVSGRDRLEAQIFYYLLNEANIFQLLVGRGADGTLEVTYNYAHNDWLEIAVNQGLLGVVIYLSFFVAFFRQIRSANVPKDYKVSLAMLYVILFTRTLFSMSYSEYNLSESLIMGYLMAHCTSINIVVSNSKLRRVRWQKPPKTVLFKPGRQN